MRGGVLKLNAKTLLNPVNNLGKRALSEMSIA